MAVIVEFSVLPVGLPSTSLSKYVAHAIRVLEQRGVKYQLNPMSTAFEAESVKEALEIVAEVHESLFELGVKRVLTSVKIDDRRDKRVKMEDKVNSVAKALKS